ncbi:hypothetical protein GmHk_05G013191 [Glycine max]|nr:hypothetical protein GmHk_05G013191 [Glycine max]
MDEIEEVKEWMKADMEAMKEKMAIMMEAMMSMKKIMKVNAAAVAVTSAVAEVDLTPPSTLNQINHPTSDMVGQGGKELGNTGGPHFVQVQSKHAFPPYDLPPNYTPLNVAHTLDENVDNSAPIPIESQQPQFDNAHVSQPMGETHEAPRDHNLADFKPHLEYVIEGKAIEYAQWWKDLAAPVAPSTIENEMITMIVDTLLVFYYEKMVGYTPSSFADLVFAGERIELNNVITQPISTFRITHHPISQEHLINHKGPPLNQPQRPPIAHPIPNATLNTNQSTNQGRNFPKKKLVEFTPIPVSYADLLLYLVDNAMVAITPAKVPQPPFFRGYNSNTTCAYHGGVPGHSIEHCITLKHKVQNLIDAGWLKFEEDNRS